MMDESDLLKDASEAPDETLTPSPAPTRSALVEIRMVNIHFPFEPYEIQKDYMSAVIECLQKRWNGLLESPTGTGKTLSLLCSSLAWLEDRKAAVQLEGIGGALPGLRPPDPSHNANPGPAVGTVSSSFDRSTQILYSSRTHSQLSQASRELKRTRYGYMNSIVLGSRDQLCINTEVSSLPSGQQKIRRCQLLVNTRACEYYRNYETKVSHEDYSNKHVIDIEDLVALGRRHQCCPYYATKILRKKSDVIFLPYNYVVDPSTRRSQAIELDGNVVIFDEAHNIEGFCEDSLSFSMTSTDLAASIKELDGIGSALLNAEDADNLSFGVEELSVLKTMLLELEKKFDAASESGKHYDGDFLVQMFKETEIDGQHEKIIGLIDSVLKYVQSISSQGGLWGPKGVGLQKALDMLNTVYSGGTPQQLKQSFKLYFEQQKEPAHREVFVVEKKRRRWELHFVCLAPGVRMNSIVMAGVHSLILTSGTLSPMGTLATELGVPFQVQLSNDHIITADRISVMCVAQGPDRTELISTYQNRSNERYIRSLGLTLNEMSRRIPHGTLVFFPSFACMKSLVEKWTETGIMKRLRENKLVLQEESGSASFTSTIQCYRDAVVNNPQGAMLFAVCRGKSSEGVDFSDEFARAVVIVGIPYAPRQDNRVMLKMDYLNKHGSGGINGMAWYQIQALRAINQAIGRVIRHRNDYGVILFVDKRFSEAGNVSQLSKWVRHRVETVREFRKALVGISTFFQSHNDCVRSRSTNFGGESGSSGMGFINSAQRLPPPNSLTSSVLASQKNLVDVDRVVGKASKELVNFYKNAGDIVDQGAEKSASGRGRSALQAVEEMSRFNSQAQAIDNLPTLAGLKKRSTDSAPPKRETAPKKRKLNVPLRDILGTADCLDEATESPKVENCSQDSAAISVPTNEASATSAKTTDLSATKSADRRESALEVMKAIMSEFKKHCSSVVDWRKRITDAIKTYRETHDLSLFCQILSGLLLDAKAQLEVDLLLHLSNLTPTHRCRLAIEMMSRVAVPPESAESLTLKKLADNLGTLKSPRVVVHILRWALSSEANEKLLTFFESHPVSDLDKDAFKEMLANPAPAQRVILEKIKATLPAEDYRLCLKALKNFTVTKDVAVLVNDGELRKRLSRTCLEDFVMLLNVKYFVDFMVGMCR